MSNYGIGYKGSKNKIAPQILDLFPRKTNFYDLFCGGGAITHCALMRGDYQNYYMNDINPFCTSLFSDAIHGKYKNESRWISREDFFNYKDSDAYINICWSFGNMGKTYLYGDDVEPYKKALHYAIVFKDYSLLKKYFNYDFSFLDDIESVNKRRILLQRFFKEENIGVNTPLESYMSCSELLQSFTRLQSLERLNALSKLEKLKNKNLVSSVDSYENIKINQDSVIYCDIPYKDTDGYNNQEFDFNKFYRWCENQSELLFISSYDMPSDRFEEIKSIEHRCTLTGENHYKVLEKVYIPKHQIGLYKKYQPQPSLFIDMW